MIRTTRHSPHYTALQNTPVKNQRLQYSQILLSHHLRITMASPKYHPSITTASPTYHCGMYRMSTRQMCAHMASRTHHRGIVEYHPGITRILPRVHHPSITVVSSSITHVSREYQRGVCPQGKEGGKQTRRKPCMPHIDLPKPVYKRG